MSETRQGRSGAAPAGGYERRDLSVRMIGMFLLGLAVTVAAVLLLMWWMFNDFAARESKMDVPPSPLAVAPVPPAPRLQVAPGKELEALRAEEDAILNGYGWVDRTAGVVRIPIDRAMKLLAERGMPVRSRKEGTR